MSNEKKYNTIIKHYEDCLDKHGDTHLGVDWPKAEDVNKRYRVMCDLFLHREKNLKHAKLLDFGCGAAHLLEYIQREEISGIAYSGLDISEKFVALSKKKFPQQNFYCLDILENSGSLPIYDYIVANGAFTEKRDLSYEEMFIYLCSALKIIFAKAEKGIAFNLMSKHVNWEREDLFHVPFDEIASFISKELSRNFVFRSDYGLYEYTVYVYKQPELNG